MRVFITGPGGGGKSTLARTIAARNGIPFFELDDIHWIREPQGDVRRSLEDKIDMLEALTLKPDWVIEGVQFKWADSAIERADHIIIIDPTKSRNIFQITLRFMKQVVGLEAAKYRPTFKVFCDMIGWFNDYHRYERTMMFEKMRPYEHKLHIMKTSNFSSMKIQFPAVEEENLLR